MGKNQGGEEKVTKPDKQGLWPGGLELRVDSGCFF
jgi:hypothetical protein